MRITTRRPLLLLALSALLAACGGPTPPARTSHAALTFYPPPVADPPPALAVGVGLIDPDELEGSGAASALLPAALVEVEGLLLGPLGFVGDDGSVEVPLPAPEDLAAVLVPAADLLHLAGELCTPEVSDGSVKVTRAVLGDGIAVPGFLVITPLGLAYGLATPEEVETFEDDGYAAQGFYGLVYADGPVDVVALSDACVADEVTADVSLKEGWNWVRWTVVLDESDTFSHVLLQNAAAPTRPKLTYYPYF